MRGDPRIRHSVENHLETYLGEPSAVWHEIVSDLIHLDVLMWRPTPSRRMFTFVTSGMSALPMAVPEDAKRRGITDRAELVLCLPEDWPVGDERSDARPWAHPGSYYPVRWLKELARLPHDYQTWVGSGHSVPNGDPPRPLADDTLLCGWLLLPPRTLPASFGVVELGDGRRMHLLAIVALHRDEMSFKLDYGVDAILESFDRHRVDELFNPGRRTSLSL